MNLNIDDRNKELQFEGPVAVFWKSLELPTDKKASAIWGRSCIAVAYCILCYRFDRSWLRVEGDKYAVLPDEKEALFRLKDRWDCPHTETAEIIMGMLALENPSL